MAALSVFRAIELLSCHNYHSNAGYIPYACLYFYGAGDFSLLNGSMISVYVFNWLVSSFAFQIIAIQIQNSFSSYFQIKMSGMLQFLIFALLWSLAWSSSFSCSVSPCQNGGLCTSAGSCTCASGYIGDDCGNG